MAPGLLDGIALTWLTDIHDGRCHVRAIGTDPDVVLPVRRILQADLQIEKPVRVVS